MSFYQSQNQYGRGFSNEEKLRSEVLQKVLYGLIAAAFISVAITYIPIPVIFYFLAIGLEFVIVIAGWFASNESTLEKLYYAFVATTAVVLGFTLTVFLSFPGGMQMVATAFSSTGLIVGGMYYYTSVYKPDTSGMRKILLPALLILFVVSIVSFFVAFSNTMYLLFSIGGAILFSLYLYYDLGRLMNDQYRSPARMAWMIYWDILLIFKFILQALFFNSRR